MSDTRVKEVQQTIDKINNGDLDGFTDTWSEDVVWRIGGDHPLTGVHRGRGAVLGITKKVFALSDGTSRFEPVEILADDRHIVMIVKMTGQRDGKDVDMSVATFITVDEQGKWNSCWWLPSDQQAYNNFWR